MLGLVAAVLARPAYSPFEGPWVVAVRFERSDCPGEPKFRPYALLEYEWTVRMTRIETLDIEVADIPEFRHFKGIQDGERLTATGMYLSRSPTREGAEAALSFDVTLDIHGAFSGSYRAELPVGVRPEDGTCVSFYSLVGSRPEAAPGNPNIVKSR